MVATEGRSVIQKLLSTQTEILNFYYRRRKAPHLADSLTMSIATIETDSDTVRFELDYPKTIRFLDLKEVASRYEVQEDTNKRRAVAFKKKSRYYPVYNRPLYGHIYGKGYSLSTIINSALNQEYQNFKQALENVIMKFEP